MARLLLTLLLLNRVDIFNATDCHADFIKLQEGRGVENEIVAGAARKKEHRLHRTGRDIKQEDDLELKIEMAEKLKQLRNESAKKPYTSNLEFRQKIIKQYFQMRKQGDFIKSEALAKNMNKTIEFQRNYLKFQNMLIEARKKRENLTLGPEYRIYIDHQAKIMEYMTKLKEEGVSKSIVVAKMADKMYEYWFNHVDSLRRNKRDTNKRNQTRLPFKENMLARIEHLKFNELDILSDRINKTYELLDEFFAFQKMIEEGNIQGPEFERQNETYGDLTARSKRYMKALKAKGFPDDVINEKLADKINEYLFKKNETEIKHRTRRAVNKRNQTRLPFKENMLARIEHLRFKEIDILSERINKTYELLDNFFAFQKMIKEGYIQGPDFVRQNKTYGDLIGRSKRYMKALKAKGFPDDVINEKLADKINEYLFKKTETQIKHRTRRAVNKRNQTRLPFKENMLARIEHLRFKEIDILSERINKTYELLDNFFAFQKMIKEGYIHGPDFVRQNKTYGDLIGRSKRYMKALKAKGFPDDVINEKLADKINEYLFKKTETEIKHRTRRAVNKRNQTRLPFKENMLARIEHLRFKEIDILSERINKTYELLDNFFAFQKMIKEGYIQGPDFVRQNKTYGDLIGRSKRYMKALKAKGFPDDVINEKLADKINEYLFKKTETQLKHRTRRAVNKRNQTRLPFKENMLARIEHLRFKEIDILSERINKTYELLDNFFAFQKMIKEGYIQGPDFVRQNKTYGDLIGRSKRYMKALKAKGFPDDVINEKLADKINEYFFKKTETQLKHRTRRAVNKRNHTALESGDNLIKHMKNLSDQGRFEELKKICVKVMKDYQFQEKFLALQKALQEVAKSGVNMTLGQELQRNIDTTKRIIEYIKTLNSSKGFFKQVKEDDKRNNTLHRTRRDTNKQSQTVLEFRDKMVERMNTLSRQGETEEMEKLVAKVNKSHELRQKYFKFQQNIVKGKTEGPEFQRENEIYDDLTSRIEKYIEVLKAQGFPESVIEDKVADKINEYWFHLVESNHRTRRDVNKQNQTVLEFRDKLVEHMRNLSLEGNTDELEQLAAKVNKTRDLQEKYLAFQNMLADAAKKGENVTQGPEYKRQMEHTKNRVEHMKTLKQNLTGLPKHVKEEIVADKMYEYWFKHVESSHTRRDVNKQDQTVFEFRNKLVEHLRNLSSQGKTEEFQKLAAKILKTYELQEKYLAFQKRIEKGNIIEGQEFYEIYDDITREIHKYIEVLKAQGSPDNVIEDKVVDKMYECCFKHVEPSHRNKRDTNKQNHNVLEFRDKLVEHMKNLSSQGNTAELEKLSAMVIKTRDLQEKYLTFHKMLADAAKKGENVTQGPDYKIQMEHTNKLLERIKTFKKNLTGLPQHIREEIVADKMYEYWFKYVESLHRTKRDANEQNHTVVKFRDKLAKQVRELERQRNADELIKLSAIIFETRQLQDQYLAFQNMLEDAAKKGENENVVQGPDYKIHMERTNKLQEHMKTFKENLTGLPKHVREEIVADRMYEYWFKHVQSLHRIKRDANEQNHTVLEFRDRIIKQVKELENQGNYNQLKQLQAKVTKAFELQRKYETFQKMLQETVERGENITEGPEYKRNMEYTKDILEYIKDLKGHHGLTYQELEDRVGDKMNEYWFKHVESSSRNRRDTNEQNHTVLEFREKLIGTMKNLRNQGNVDELKKLSAKIKKTFELQEKYLAFQKILADKVKKGERVFKGPEYESNLKHTKKIVKYMNILKEKGIPEDVVKEKIADKMNEYWFKHVEETST